MWTMQINLYIYVIGFNQSYKHKRHWRDMSSHDFQICVVNWNGFFAMVDS